MRILPWSDSACDGATRKLIKSSRTRADDDADDRSDVDVDDDVDDEEDVIAQGGEKIFI